MTRNSILFVLFAMIAISSFNSCKEDEFLDWKLMNKQWLVEHQNDSGFTTTASGVQYKLTTKNEIDSLIVTSDKYNVTILIEGRYITGEKDFFIPPTDQEKMTSIRNLPKGLQEILRLMPKDAEAEVRVPQELGFGDKKEGGIPPYSTLIYKITLKNANAG